MSRKHNPYFTWYRWGIGAEKWGFDTRQKTATILRGARKRGECERIGNGQYRVTLRGYDVMALIRTQ
jgi:hypothetical protein